MKNEKYLVRVNNCPHCKEDLDYSSEGKELKRTMYSIFKLIEIHRSECLKIKGRMLININIREKGDSDIAISFDYKTNKILF